MEKRLLDYWIILYRKRMTIAFVMVISVVTTLVLGWVLKPVYEAKAVCYVPSTSPALTYLSGSPTSGLTRDILVPKTKEDDSAPYLGLLKSRRIAELTHADFPKKNVEKLISSDMSFELSDEFMLKIYARDSDPVVAANVSNAYMKYLNLLLQEASLKNPELDKGILNGQMATVEKSLAEAKNALKNFSEKNSIVSVDEEIKNLTAQKTSYQDKVDSTSVLIRENEEKIKATLEQLNKEGNVLEKNSFILSSPTLDYMRNKLSDLTAQIGGQSVELKESHPDMKILKSQYKEMTDKLRLEVKNLVEAQIKPAGTFYEGLRNNLANLIIESTRLQATRKGNSVVIEKINERMQKMPSINAEWGRLNDNVEHYKKIYEQIKNDLQESDMQRERPIQYVITVDYAKPPKTPAFPVIWLNVLAAIFFGLAAGVFYSFLVEYISETRKVRTLKIIKAIITEKAD